MAHPVQNNGKYCVRAMQEVEAEVFPRGSGRTIPD